MIIRASKTRGYTAVRNKSFSDDCPLSWAARGVLVSLLCKPDHWQTNITHLIKVGNLGKDGMRTVIRELIHHGYLTKDAQSHAADGQFGTVSYTVNEVPVTEVQNESRESTSKPAQEKQSNTGGSVQSKETQQKERTQGVRKSAGRKKARKGITSVWEISAPLKQWCVSKGVTNMKALERVRESFVDHHMQKGNMYADWDAAFRNWVKGALDRDHWGYTPDLTKQVVTGTSTYKGEELIMTDEERKRTRELGLRMLEGGLMKAAKRVNH